MNRTNLKLGKGIGFRIKIVEDKPDGKRYIEEYAILKIEEIDKSFLRITDQNNKTRDIQYSDLNYIEETLFINKKGIKNGMYEKR